jgi:CBS domain-containing protein
MTVKTILAEKGSEVVSIDFTADLAAAAKLLTKHRIGALVVLGAGGRLAGILSERDIVRAIAESGITALQLPIAQVMTRNVSTCDINDSINSVVERMTKGKFRHSARQRPPRRDGIDRRRFKVVYRDDTRPYPSIRNVYC